jgi:hypothetical protein
MIGSFRCPETKAIHERFGSRKFRGIEEQARKRLRWLEAATSLTDLGAISEQPAGGAERGPDRPA